MSSTDDEEGSRLTRRTVLALAAAAGAATTLAACGGSTDGETGGNGAAQDDATQDESSAPSEDEGGSPSVLAKAADVPVGSGVILTDPKMVITQPTEGEFRGFSSICTHQGCAVSGIKGKTINCGCHGSAFNVADGSVVNGPATRPLREIKVKVDGDSVVKA